MSCVIRMEQNFGPHIEQNLADLNTSCAASRRASPGGLRVERQLELAIPVEFEASLGKLVVALTGVLAAASDVAGVAAILYANHSLADVSLLADRDVPWE